MLRTLPPRENADAKAPMPRCQKRKRSVSPNLSVGSLRFKQSSSIQHPAFRVKKACVVLDELFGLLLTGRRSFVKETCLIPKHSCTLKTQAVTDRLAHAHHVQKPNFRLPPPASLCNLYMYTVHCPYRPLACPDADASCMRHACNRAG